MRKIYLLFFLALMALQFNARAERINVPGLEVPKLIITEVRPDNQATAYVELTNIGDTPIDLAPFTLHSVHFNTRCTEYSDSLITFNRLNAAVDNTIGKIFLKGTLDPGESYVVANVWDAKDSRGRDIPNHNTAIAQIGDQFAYRQETQNDNGWINKPEWQCFGMDSFLIDKTYGSQDVQLRGEETVGYLLHWVYEVDSVTMDSTYVDQFNHYYSREENVANGINVNMKGYRNDPIAGVVDAMRTSIMVRKANVTKGNLSWSQSRGTDPTTSEWLVLPKNTSKQLAFTTVGIHGGVHDLDYTAKDPSKVMVDEGASTISVPWELVRGDSLARHFNLGEGMGWSYDLVGVFEDTASYIARTGDKFAFYAVGNEVQMKEFTLQVREAEADLAVVFPRRRLIIDEEELLDEETGEVIDTLYTRYWSTGFVYALSEGPEIDSIINVPFATRVDSLFKYLDKPEKASWEIISVDGEDRVDLKFGDKLKVTSEDGANVKEYFVAVEDHVASNNALLRTVTWPDIDKSKYPRWNVGDTLPEFTPLKTAYNVELRFDAKQIPAFQFKPQSLRAKVNITNAIDLNGNRDQRTTTVEVIAESDTISNTYYFTFEKAGTPVQPNTAEPFISEMIWNVRTQGCALEIYNPGTDEIDLSQYMYVAGSTSQTWQEAVATTRDGYFAGNPNDGLIIYQTHYIPGKRWKNDGSQDEWEATPDEENPTAGPGFFRDDNQTDTWVAGGDVWVGGVGTSGTNAEQVKIRAESDFIWRGAGETLFAWDSTKLLHRETPIWNDPRHNMWLLKVLNDSILDGTKDCRINDPGDYMLIDRFEVVGDTIAGRLCRGKDWDLIRKPSVSKGTLELTGGGSSTPESSEWIIKKHNDAGESWSSMVANIGLHTMTPVTNYLSTVTSIKLQVKPGFVGDLTITGNIEDYTVETIASVLDAADSSQVWVFKRGATVLANDAALLNGDVLEVTSGDGNNTSVYELINSPLDNDTSLTAKAGGPELAVEGTMVTGVTVGMTLKEALADLEIAPTSILNVLDASGALQPLTMHNLDTLVYDVLVSEDIMLEVVAENKDAAVYYFDFGLASNEAILLSNIIVIDQENKRIMELPLGSTSPSMLSILFANEGASFRILDKAGFERTTGFIKVDDVVEVTAPDGVTKVIYGFDEGMFPVSVEADLQRAGEFMIYPNPVNNVLNFEGMTPSVIEVYSIAGSKMIYDTDPSYTNKIDVRSLPRGIYVIKLTDEQGRVEVDKFLKK